MPIPELHRVIYSGPSGCVAVRSSPSLTAEVLDVRNTGEVVELCDWDKTHTWRQCVQRKGWMMLHHPVHGRLLEVVKSNWSVTFPGETALGKAVRDRCTGEVRRLLDRRADPNEPDNIGETPLFEAASRGETALVAMLLDARADPAYQSVSGLTAFDFAKDTETSALLAAMNPAQAVSADKIQVTKALKRVRRASLLGRTWDRVKAIEQETEDETKAQDEVVAAVTSPPSQGFAPMTPPTSPRQTTQGVAATTPPDGKQVRAGFTDVLKARQGALRRQSRSTNLTLREFVQTKKIVTNRRRSRSAGQGPADAVGRRSSVRRSLRGALSTVTEETNMAGVQLQQRAWEYPLNRDEKHELAMTLGASNLDSDEEIDEFGEDSSEEEDNDPEESAEEEQEHLGTKSDGQAEVLAS